MSDDDHETPEDRRLEKELEGLVPSKMKADFLQELARDHERVSRHRRSQRRRSWMIPSVALACIVAMSFIVYNTTQRATHAMGGEGQSSESLRESRPGPTLSPSPLPQSNVSGFEPVSSEGYLIDASSRGISESGLGLEERFDLDFRDVDHWHNPATATDIRIITPRHETIVIPVPTD
jgi:hypothetical protein